MKGINQMSHKTLSVASACVFAAMTAMADGDGFSFDAGADVRVRHELMDNVPGLPGGGLLLRAPRGDFRQHMRFRPRVWGEVSFGSESVGSFRLYTRLTDEFRWCPEPRVHRNTFPDELILDNLYLEGCSTDSSISRSDVRISTSCTASTTSSSMARLATVPAPYMRTWPAPS